MARVRGIARQSTGGLAPRKQLNSFALRQFQRRHPLIHDQYVSDKGNQTYANQSDAEVQNSVVTVSVGTQTEEQDLAVQVEKELDVASDIIVYLEDTVAALRSKLHDAENSSKLTSTCSKACCKKN